MVMRKNLIFLVFIFYYGLSTIDYGLVYALNLDHVKARFLQGDYKAAIKEGEKLIAASMQNSSRLDELYYYLGVSYLKDTNYLRASDIFEIILKEFSDSAFQDEATLGLGDTYFLRGNYDKAKEYYQRLISAAGRGRLKPEAYYRLSQCAFRLGNSEEGAKYLRKLKDGYPMSPELVSNKDLSALADTNKLYYTVQVGAFSGKARAEGLKNKLAREGYPAYIEDADTSRSVSYRVRVGKFHLLQEAVELEKKLIQEGYPTKIFP